MQRNLLLCLIVSFFGLAVLQSCTQTDAAGTAAKGSSVVTSLETEKTPEAIEKALANDADALLDGDKKAQLKALEDPILDDDDDDKPTAAKGKTSKEDEDLVADDDNNDNDDDKDLDKLDTDEKSAASGGSDDDKDDDLGLD